MCNRGARESWRKSNNELHKVGFAITESTSIAVKSNTGTSSAVPEKKNLVSFSGGGISNEVTTSIPSTNNKKMVKFSGGFNFAEVPITAQSDVANSEVISETAQSQENNEAEDSSVLVGESDDGCSLFSTGG